MLHDEPGRCSSFHRRAHPDAMAMNDTQALKAGEAKRMIFSETAEIFALCDQNGCGEGQDSRTDGFARTGAGGESRMLHPSGQAELQGCGENPMKEASLTAWSGVSPTNQVPPLRCSNACETANDFLFDCCWHQRFCSPGQDELHNCSL